MKRLVALSGGKDSTAMALRLVEVEPAEYQFVCTPTGNELPEMRAHWNLLERLLGQEILRLQVATLTGTIEHKRMLPNPRMRWCTRILKIEPFVEVLQALVRTGPVVSYVGIRADEPFDRGVFYGIDGVTERFPLREWGWGVDQVLGYLADRDVYIPKRTDCALCFFQRLGEWFELWREHPEEWAEGERLEALTGHTFRSAGRDSWPASMAGLRQEFERGRIPKGWGQGDLLRSMQCRTCSL